MDTLEANYRQRFDTVLRPMATALETQLQGYFKDELRIDRITARPKDVQKFLKKAARQENGKSKYAEPLRQIQDQIGARIVTFYLSDVERVAKVVEKYYRSIETKDIYPDSEREFGYVGRHYIFFVPNGLHKSNVDRNLVPEVFELQLKTLFQHAWSEADHDLGYKPDGKTPNTDQKRQMAFVSAQAWGADRVFDELFRSLVD